jgi:hypothetical protein
MTNAGKTHTIQGTANNPGSLPRLVEEIFKREEFLHEECELKLSILEIYQEDIFDLLSDVIKDKRKDKLKIRDAGDGRMEVSKLSDHQINSSEEAFKLMDIATANRSNSKTKLNSGSSRSHAVYSLTLTKKETNQSSTFYIVDLAGAERMKRTDASAAQQKEANSINTSLMQLWRCIQAMKQRKQDIPFRESKLTHLLMPYFAKAGLQGITMMACVNPQAQDYDETVSVLSNISLACKVREIAFRAPDPEKDKENNNCNSKRQKSSIASTVNNDKKSMNPTTSTAGRNKRSSSLISDVTCDTTLHNYHEGTEEELMNLPIVKQLRSEINRLKNENEELLNNQWKRETEIRIEVSEEMAKRSAHLLDQIQELQEEVNLHATSQVGNIQKSCKKARRQQREEIAGRSEKDLEEAEEEMERMKTYYENEIQTLTEGNKKLLRELNDWKSKAKAAATNQGKASSSAPSHMPSNAADSVVPFTSDENSKPAEKFSQRMQRDKRFKKGGKGRAGSKSPTRSPLGKLNNDAGNSPLRMKSPLKSIAEVVKPNGKRKDVEASGDNETNSKTSNSKKAKLVNANDSSFLEVASDEQENTAPPVSSATKLPKKGAFTPILSKLRARFVRA